MLSHHAERAQLKGKRSPRRSALELFSINICYNLRIERHNNVHLCGQRPSIIIQMGSIYIHMYKPHSFIYIYIYKYIKYYIALSFCCTAQNCWLDARQQGQLEKIPSVCNENTGKREPNAHFLCLHQVLLLLKNKTKSYRRPMTIAWELTGNLRKQETHYRLSDGFKSRLNFMTSSPSNHLSTRNEFTLAATPAPSPRTDQRVKSKSNSHYSYVKKGISEELSCIFFRHFFCMLRHRFASVLCENRH